MKFAKLAAPGLAAAYAAGWIVTSDMYAKADTDSKKALYRYGAAAVAAIAVGMILHRAG